MDDTTEKTPQEPLPTDQVGTVKIGEREFTLHRGLTVTIDRLPDGTDKVTGYAVQKAWYDHFGKPEPKRVKERREAAEERARSGSTPDGGSTAAEPIRGSTPRAPTSGPKASDLIRKGLLEGADTETIVATVKAFNPAAKVDAKVVAGYRHALRKEGKLAPAKKAEA